jgi:phosphatidate phosphatase PAH1
MRIALVSILAVGCTQAPGSNGIDPNGVDAGEGGGIADGSSSSQVPDIRCQDRPDAGLAAVDFDHAESNLATAAGEPTHRGFDLVTTASAATQELSGWISYGAIDKALERELVEVYACRAGAWQLAGTARTDGEGHFALPLTGDARLPIGMRDVFVSVVGDRTGVGFLAYVAPEGSPLVVSDVDGTLTTSENAFIETVALGVEPDANPGAAPAFAAATAKGDQVVYVTARGNQYTETTRRWLAAHGFPRGPVRLAPSFVTLPGGDTVAFKTSAIAALASAGLALHAGIGNRETDIEAYAASGLASDRIYIELPEFRSEVQASIDAGRAVGFETYDALRATAITGW